MSQRVTVSFTPAEANALLRLAACSADTESDARTVLTHPAKVAAGYRAIDALQSAIYFYTHPTHNKNGD